MEASSPLAALHRPSLPAWGSSSDIFRAHSHSHFPSSSGSNSMSLREQMHRNTTDYFNAKDIRGSSPAASLAADLSQNFRLDNEASPHFPTPRRALFTAGALGGIEHRSFTTTPPLPASSPGGLTEYMEISPLPHKAPMCTQIEVTSPTPLSTPADTDMMLDSPMSSYCPLSLEPPMPLLAERKIAAPRRPSLSRMKGFTTSAVSGRGQHESFVQPFRFGSDSSSSLPLSRPSLSLSECFESASPPQERSRPLSANSPCPPVSMHGRSRHQFSSMNIHRPSPINTNFQPRKPPNPFLRNRKQMRRSLSMFEHPADIMKPKVDAEDVSPTTLQSVSDVEEAHVLVLPHSIPEDPTDTIPRITQETLLDVLDGKYSERYTNKMIIDCRFEYEYEGGHIDGAVNYNDKELLATQLFKAPMGERTLLIFHCEYSAHRAPLMARHVRSEDRTANAEMYPKLTYPEVYILEGGYSGFFAEHRGRCYPPCYVEMSDEKHQRTCEREMGRLRARKTLGRAQTFAFGQREMSVHDSPTGFTPSAPRTSLLASIEGSPIYSDRCQSRRMASY